MFGIRIKQLERRLSATSLIPEGTAKKLLFQIRKIYDVLSQIDLVGQIYSRFVAKLSSEEITESEIKKLEVLKKIGELLIKELNNDPDSITLPIKDFDQLTIDEKKFEKIQEDLRSLNKNQNKNITSFDNLVDFLVENSYSDIDNVDCFENFNHIYEYTFNIELEGGACNPAQMENINIKELIMMNYLDGPLIKKIFDKYDGLLAYTMSLLTMITGTEYGIQFKERLGGVMHSLGTSTQITLLSQQLNKHLQRKEKIVNKIENNKKKVKTTIHSHQLDLNLETVDKFYSKILNFQNLNKDTQIEDKIQKYPEFTEIFSSAVFNSVKEEILQIWDDYYSSFTEIIISLNKLNEFFTAVVKKTNTITADLFSVGFRASLPKNDIDTCEKAGLHIKNITSTSSTKKIDIDEEYFDVKAKLIRQFDDDLNKLNAILANKSREELLIRDLAESKKVFSKTFAYLQKNMGLWKRNNVLDGYMEEVVFVARAINSVEKIIKKSIQIMDPINNITIAKNNIHEFEHVFNIISKCYIKFRKIISLVLHLNSITKKMWKVNKEILFKITREKEFIESPEQILKLIEEIPKIITREFRQRLITDEVKKKKTEHYLVLKDMVEEFISNFGESERELFLPYEDIDKSVLKW